MKTALRENRSSGGTKAKADRIAKELRNYPAHLQPHCPARGVFAAWAAGRGRTKQA